MEYSKPTNQNIKDFINHCLIVFLDEPEAIIGHTWDTFGYYYLYEKLCYQFFYSKTANYHQYEMVCIIKTEDLIPHLKKYLLLT